MTDQIADWALRVIMTVIMVLVAMWGRRQQHFDQEMHDKAAAAERALQLELALRDRRLGEIEQATVAYPVSYTHLTLPTILRV